MLRAVIIDDSQVARDLLLEVLTSDPEISVVGVGRDGVEGVQIVEQLKPDVVTMDVQMPGLDGYAATEQIMTRCPTPIVVVSGSDDHPNVEKSMKALAAGALTVVGKPPAPTADNFESVSSHIVDTVRTMASVRVVRRRSANSSRTASDVRGPEISPDVTTRPELIAIAASTGGPHALHELLQSLPGDFPVPIVVVQHISPGFVDGLVRWLDGAVPLKISIAQDGQQLKPGHVYFAPDSLHCGIDAGIRFKLVDQAPVGGFRPSANVLFETAARATGKSTVAVILTGMGSDGVDGVRILRQAGGTVVSQDEETCVVYGMPRAAAEAGLSNTILPLPSIADHLIRITSDSSVDH